MAVTQVSESFNPQLKLHIIVLEDAYGAQHHVQLVADASKAAENDGLLQAEVAMFQAREQAFTDYLTAHKQDPAQFHKQPSASK